MFISHLPFHNMDPISNAADRSVSRESSYQALLRYDNL